MADDRCCSAHACFIVPPKLLRKLGDLDTALLSERLRGQRLAFKEMGFAAVGVPAGGERRTIYDAGHATRLPGALVRGEGGPRSKDEVVNQAYDSSGDTYDFYWKTFKRNSVDGRGMRLDSTVHYGTRFNNAFWNGRQMVYGDGDGQLFTGFASAIDVVGHELTHGVTQYTVPGGLTYDGQSGALNESISDVFGTLVKQWKLGQDVNAASWLIGEGIMGAKYGKALRSMKAPGTAWTGDDQPGDMGGYVQDGDVHTNSGIPNHAFFLAAMALGGHAWEKAGPIWYRTLPMLHPDATFAEAARATIDAAGLLYGAGAEQAAVQAAWKGVKVL
ncbi:M4 family metallopeptidase [Anaeromyxobacter diazotrophicus]|uniref:Neutral metalloproteinase n=1 Tax=Anaeromyxobacter diazotrophicus TaxID=2590199 RepID=A0A7I9VNT0_9BACT|nr:M4 family metallopeptidase [Anaeromyxobacter diazotrophicus]GEJ57760.1 metalloprotease [Anaeromyxobacter diazotrophicus]